MKFTLMTLTLALMTMMPFTHKAQAMDESATEAPITAILFYADSCGACKILDPKLKEALNAINQNKIDMVKFDFSNRTKIEETKALAIEKNLNSTLQKYGAKTGFVVLVNQDGEIVETLKADDDKGALAGKMATAIAQAS